MDRTDIVAGAALLAAGVWMAVEAQSFPSLGGMAYGPSLFPTVIAFGLMGSGVGIAVEGGLARTPAPDASGEGTGSGLVSSLLVLATLAGFSLLLPILGFHLSAALAVFASMRIFGGGLVASLATTLLAPVIVHWIFYSLLRVPLPWGLLTPVAW